MSIILCITIFLHFDWMSIYSYFVDCMWYRLMLPWYPLMLVPINVTIALSKKLAAVANFVLHMLLLNN